MIRIDKLHKFFNKGRQNEIHVINDVSLELGERGMVAIFGKSGCGKTTLLNLIGGLDKYATGSLTIDGQSITEDTDVIRNRYIGYIFQNYNLNKSETCFDNVADALRLCGMTDEEEIEKRVTAALTNVGMEKFAKRPPDTLSGGQQQRIAIARAIVKNPRIILADEPTGNLDEANTVMIMDLLKAISKDHLVILVTHEANLVDFYCDTVIELSDGKIAGIKQNSSANGFSAKDKNDIWLGELDMCELKSDNAEVKYYGEKPEAPIRLRIVNNGGKIYVSIDNDKVQLIDGTSEVKLREGVFEEKAHLNSISQNIDMSGLPSVDGTSFGKLFTFKSSLKSGYAANFKNRKKGKKLLRACMCLFSAVLVFMSASFGTVFNEIIKAKQSYNHNVFYIYTPDKEVSEKLNAAVGSEESAIDFIRLMQGYPSGDTQISFRVGSFETFDNFDNSFKTNAVLLDASLIKDAKLVEGKKDGISDDEVIITTRVADSLLEISAYGYISERADLIGLVSGIDVRGKNMRIAGIVESKESAIYMNEIAMAKYMPSSALPSYSDLASLYGFEVDDGETILINSFPYESTSYPRAGETIKIQGKELTVKEVISPHRDYDEWIKAMGIEKKSEKEFFTELLISEDASLENDLSALKNAISRAMEDRHYEYLDYYYAQAREFYEDLFFFDPHDINLWLYLEKNVEIAKFYMLPDEYAKAVGYKMEHGRYPTVSELQGIFQLSPFENINIYIDRYNQEFYMQEKFYPFTDSLTYLVSDSTYVGFTKQLGESHSSATRTDIYYWDDKIYFDSVPEGISPYSSAVGDVFVDDIFAYNSYYTVIHSSDPEKTELWLNEHFGDLEDPDEYQKALITPDLLFAGFIESKVSNIGTGLTTMAVLLVLMCICMYFIMRSSLMNRIKEIGIYRAIGVSRKNLIFKFFVEALLLATLTVFVGYMITSAFIYTCVGTSALVAEVFFYPIWLALIILAVLYTSTVLFGIIPIIDLLLKTPSEILAKYDI